MVYEPDVAEKRVLPLESKTIEADNVRLPLIVKSEPVLYVPVNPEKFKFKQLTEVPWVTVTAPDAASKNTSSVEVGTAAPPAPPDVVAHLVPAVAFQVFVPPTQ
jgi:hypothetical protein